MNRPPVIQAVAEKSEVPDEEVSFVVTATDPDLPTNTLSFSLSGVSAGAVIDP